MANSKKAATACFIEGALVLGTQLSIITPETYCGAKSQILQPSISSKPSFKIPISLFAPARFIT